MENAECHGLKRACGAEDEIMIIEKNSDRNVGLLIYVTPSSSDKFCHQVEV